MIREKIHISTKLFISYYPLKQGLKHHIKDNPIKEVWDLYPTIH